MTRGIPNGVTLGNKVLLVPSISYVFSHCGYIENLKTDGDGYSWLKRGDAIAKCTLREPRVDLPFLRYMLGSVDRSVTIRSPASGLLLHYIYNFANDKDDFERLSIEHSPPARFAILLPDDEPPPDSAERLFSELCRVAWDHRTPFLKPSMYWTKNAMAEDVLKTYLEEQRRLESHIYDAMPRYEAYLQEARTRHPELRPHLKHLL